MVKFLQNIVRVAWVCMIAVVLLFFSQFAYANTEACVNAANQLSNDIAEIFNEHGAQAQQYFTIRQNWSDWSSNNNPIIEGDTEYSYGVVMYASENGWVITERALNLAQETLVEDEFRQEGNDVLPERFTFPETQLIQWYEIVSQNPDWINALDNDIQDTQNLASSCNITLTVENITDGVPLILNTGSNNNQGNNEGSEEGGSEETPASVPTPGDMLEGFTFNDSFPSEGTLFYADLINDASDPLSDGSYDLKVKFAFYGEDADMIDYADSIENDLVFKFKQQGATSYAGDLYIVSSEAVAEEELSTTYAEIYDLTSQTLGSYVGPGVYQVDVLFDGSVITSLSDICLPTFTSSTSQIIGNQQCTNASISANELIAPDLGFVGPPEDPYLQFDEPHFGDGVTQFDMSTAVANVPMVNWDDQLVFRARTLDYNVEVFGINISDLQDGTASIGDFIINMLDTVGQQQYSPGDALPNLSISDIINGEFGIDDFNFPGVEIDEQEVIYDFYYDINAQLNLNGNDYDKIRVYFGRNPRGLTGGLLIADYSQGSGSLTIDEQVYNLRTDGNETENHTMRLTQGRHYYAGIYGVTLMNDGSGNEIEETIAVKRLSAYSNDVNAVGRMNVGWDSSPHMSFLGNTVQFDISGDIHTYNYIPPEELDLKFGYSNSSFETVRIYQTSESPNQNFEFSKTLQDMYAYATAQDTFDFKLIQPGQLYFMGIYDGRDLISFQQAGRTPDFANPPAVTTPPVTTTTQPGTGLFADSPMAELEAEFKDTGIVPCTGLDCNYDKIIALVQRAWKFIFIMIIPIAAIAFAYAGFLLMFKGSNPESRKKARDIFIKVMIGIVIVLSAFVLVKTILVTLGVDQSISLINLS